MKIEKYKVRMKQSDQRNIPPCFLKVAIDTVPSTIRDLLVSEGARECEGGKLMFGESYVFVRSDSTVEIHGATAEVRDRILSRLNIFDVEKTG